MNKVKIIGTAIGIGVIIYYVLTQINCNKNINTVNFIKSDQIESKINSNIKPSIVSYPDLPSIMDIKDSSIEITDIVNTGNSAEDRETFDAIINSKGTFIRIVDLTLNTPKQEEVEGPPIPNDDKSISGNWYIDDVVLQVYDVIKSSDLLPYNAFNISDDNIEKFIQVSKLNDVYPNIVNLVELVKTNTVLNYSAYSFISQK